MARTPVGGKRLRKFHARLRAPQRDRTQKKKRSPSGESGRGGELEVLGYVKDSSITLESQTRPSDLKTDGHFCAPENTTVRNASAAFVQRKSQRAAVLRLLIDAHGSWVPLPQILALGIAQYNARILELRRLGFVIENKTERVNDARHSWFRLVNSPRSAR